jgi:predicted DCC family thiol-disulfide oxidoreductase YuxK
MMPDIRESRWLVLYDADCDFCRRLLSILLRWDRAGRLDAAALPRTEADQLLLISPTGKQHSGGMAVTELLRLLPAGRLPAAALARFPRLTDRAYRWVAEHRAFFSRWIR